MAWVVAPRALINRHRGALGAGWLAGFSALCVGMAESNLGAWMFGGLLTFHLRDLWSWVVRGKGILE